ncbi:MAG: hypothetical protein Kow0062_28030 [Acidobacteriota bacterium]
MRIRPILPAVLLACAAAVPPPAGADEPAASPRRIPPAFRDAEHFKAGRAWLEALPDGTRIEIARGDGFTFTLRLEGGRLVTSLPPAQLSDDGRVLTLPGGYTIAYHAERPAAVVVTAPSGATTQFSWRRRTGVAFESDGGFWTSNWDPFVLRLTDGTRIDAMDRMTTWEAMTLAGERFRMTLPDGTWTRLPDVPSPPLIPSIRSFQAAGNGDDWRKPKLEDHLVFAWNWIQFGLPLERAIADVDKKPRRTGLRVYFNNLEYEQPPWELAAVILGRRLALGGGDRVTFRPPGREPRTAYILPGPLEPPFHELTGKRPDALPLPTQR